MVAGGAAPTAEPCVCARIGIPVTTTPAMTAFCAAAPIRLGTVVAVNEMSTRYSPAVGTRYAVAMAILNAVFAALAVLPRSAGVRRARHAGAGAAPGAGRPPHAGRRAQRQVSGRRGAGGRGAGDEGDRPDQVTRLQRNRRGVHHTGCRDGDVRRRVPPRHGFLPGRVRGGPLPQVVACEDVAVLPHDPILSAARTPPPTGARGGVSGSACSDAEGRSRETGTGDRTVGTGVATGGEPRGAEDA